MLIKSTKMEHVLKIGAHTRLMRCIVERKGKKRKKGFQNINSENPSFR